MNNSNIMNRHIVMNSTVILRRVKKLPSYLTYLKTVVFFAALLVNLPSFAASSADYTAAPPFVATNVGKPNVVIALDISGSMKAVAYRDVAAGNWKKGLHDDFNPAYDYFGYFDSKRTYSYDRSENKQFFFEDATGGWNGNYLNWLTMRRMDVVRKVLVGGKVRDRNGEIIDGNKWYILEGQNEPVDYTFRKSYSDSSSYSPIPDDQEILIANGVFAPTTADGVTIEQLSDKVEIGQISIDRDLEDLVDEGWRTIEFQNTYTVPPAVVATAVSFNGKQQTLSRVKDVTITNFKVRIEEWDYLDGNHTTEKVVFVVAEPGNHQIQVIDPNTFTVSSHSVVAGTTAINNTHPSYDLIAMGFTFPTPPVVLAATTSTIDPTAVTTRIKGISASSFEIAMQEETIQIGDHGSESLSWIALEKVSGYSFASGAALDINSTAELYTHEWQDVNFTSGIFSEAPMVAVGMQTANGADATIVRYGNNKVTKSKFDVKMQEEKSDGAGNLQHPTAESVGYLAVQSFPGYSIRIGVPSEPTGILQQNSASVRFGMAVYNYDHTLDPTSIYKKNKIDGGTFRPCYRDISKPVSEQTNFDICVDTHVKSPLGNIIDVIEDHPLIWGSTPIAETLYEIKGYFSQEDFNRGTGSHTQWYDNGTEDTPDARNSYEISEDWDPYYYPEYGTRLPCAKSFVLHFNDGAPFDDFDGDDNPDVANDGIGAFGAQQVLDDLALELRKDDCRTDTGMTGHQDIVSYYVYAALGEGEELNDNSRRMREAAANGGFVDQDNDNEPDPSHPEDFNDYLTTGAGTCDENEWDADGDCNPDTFYFASDAEQLVNQLNSALESITTRAASGGASSVIAASRSGEGAVFNAIFRPSVASGTEEVTWIGDVHALMIDDAGRLRHDDGDRVLEDSADDPYIDMCSFNSSDLKEVRIKLSNTLETRPSPAESATCSSTLFTKTLFDIEYLWSAAGWLSDLTDAQADSQRSYTSTGPGRYILTGDDFNNDGNIDRTEVVSFIHQGFFDENAGLIASSEAVADDVVKYIRGRDIDGFRKRQLNGKTMRLGDLIYSTPTVVGRPAENLDLIYGSTSYKAFFEHYRYRRQVIYAGGNDGMLHAFNGGWYDPETKQFKNAKGGGAPGSSTNFDLGAELWAYVPYNGLPHLKYLTRPNYGAVSSDHLYFMDLEPRIFDARIFPDDANHPGGWGTVLVVGSRLGGGEMTVDIDTGPDVDNRTLRSSFTLFDVTNPDVPPSVLLEFTHPDLGFTTAVPTPVFAGSDSDGNGNWYLMLGSGADTDAAGFDDVKSTQRAKLFLLNLKEIVAGSSNILVPGFGTNGILELPDDNSFVSDLSSVDFGFDNFTSDAVYFGTVSGDNTGWAGKLYRIEIQSATGAAQKPVNAWTPTVVYDPGRPITAGVSIATDGLLNRWLHVGTGRFFTRTDNLDSVHNYYLGVKEPRSADGNFTYSTLSNLINVTTSKVETLTAKLSPAPTMSPALPTGATVTQLSRRMKQYSNPTEYVEGWQRDLPTGERNFGAAAVLGGTLNYTTYNPIFDECSIKGDSRLYVLNMFTGTAGEPPILNQSPLETFNTIVVELGSNPATTPSLHVGDGYATKAKSTAIVQTSDGSIITVEQTNKNNVRSGEVSWRQL